MIVCHVGKMGSIEKEGTITQIIYNECIGEHIYSSIYDKPPKADIYILECFKNDYHKFLNFEKPQGTKVISLVHSSFPCMPATCSDLVITISNYWKNQLAKVGINSKMIYGCIDFNKYKDVKIDYNNNNYGKISRYEKGKFHDKLDKMTAKLKKNYEYNHIIISKDFPENEYYEIIRGVNINDYDAKIEALKRLSVFADAHNTTTPFIETFCVSLVEAMACGLPIIILDQGAMTEVLGDAGIICKTFEEFEYNIFRLMNDKKLKKELGKKARQRAKEFDKKHMIKQWKEVLKWL